MTAFKIPPLVLELIAEARRSQARHLDLSSDWVGFAMPAFPLECLELDGLDSLDFRGHGLSTLPEELATAGCPKYLDIRRNPVRTLPARQLAPLIIDSLQWRHLKAQLAGRKLYGLQVLPEDLDRLDELLDAVEVSGVRYVSLSGCGLSELPESVFRLGNLTSLDLSNNQLTDLPEAVGRLGNLTSLDLGDNQLTDLPEAVCRLGNLTGLNLTSNQLTDLPEAVCWLGNLTSLGLWNNQFMALPEAVGRLGNLTRLGLWNNQLTDLPEAVCRLGNLTSLDLWNNQLTDLPEAVCRLGNLTSLNLWGNQLTDLPEAVCRLGNLTSLNLWGNQLTELPEVVGRLGNLTSLDLSNNQLTDLPEALGRLGNLTSLNLSGNQLTELPEAVGLLDYLYQIDLSENPLDERLQAAYGGGIRNLLRFLQQQAAGQGIALYEAKLLIVGPGEAGKTSLMKKLADRGYPIPNPADKTTLGINVHAAWGFPWTKDNAKPFVANIWDFGGQEIQYATHQFFFTPNALYVLVTDPRRQETDYDYWLKVIRLLGKGSPVLVFLNEKGGKQVTDFDLGSYRQRFPELELYEAEADLANSSDGRVELLQQRVQQLLSGLGHVGARQPKAWQPVREAIEASRDAHHLSFGQFLDICRERGIAEESDARTLARYLSYVGVIVYFDRDELLQDFIIVDPQWAVNALYRVLDREEVQKHSGQLSRPFFFEVLGREGYEEGEIGRLLTLLTRDRFELCYPLEGQEGVYVVPQLLPAVAPGYPWDAADNLRFEYQYPFMPKGLMARFIVRLYEHLAKDDEGGQLVWQKGALFAYRDTRAEVLESEDRQTGGKLVRVRVAGLSLERQHLFEVIRHEIEITHRRSFPNLEVNERVPCNCPVCFKSQQPRMYSYSELQKHIANRKPTIYCAEGNLDVPIRGLLEGILGDTWSRETDMAFRRMLAGGDSGRGSDAIYEGFVDRLFDLLRETHRLPDMRFQLSESVSQATQVSVTVEQKNESCVELSGLLEMLKEDAEEQFGGRQELERLSNELGKVQKALTKLENTDDPKAQGNRGALSRLKGFVDKLKDGNDTVGKLIGTLEGGAKTAGKILDAYNKIAPWCGMPRVPNPF